LRLQGPRADVQSPYRGWPHPGRQPSDGRIRSSRHDLYPWIPGELHGLFTVNLGVYIPEVARHYGAGEAKSWVQEYQCCVRARVGEASGAEQEIWWQARSDDAVIDDVRRRLELGGRPFLDRFSTREKVLAEWRDRSENLDASSPPRIVMAIILAERGQMGRARELLARQALETRNPGHPDYVRKLARELGVGNLDG
jgi:uncharacterized protein DUF4304